ncbi:10713_t:CDS:2, partial [Gigaspora rosea]
RTELENILIQFFVALKRKNDPKPNILDKIQFPRLFATIDGNIKLVQDTNSRQANKSDSLTQDEIIQILNDKNLLEDTPTSITYKCIFGCFLGGLRGGDAKRLKFDHVKVGYVIPPDTHDKFTPVSDISYYIFCRGTYFKSEEVFLQIASDSDFVKGIWFYDAALGRHSHEKMIKEIYQKAGVANMNHKKITNHSMRRSAIKILTQLNVTTDLSSRLPLKSLPGDHYPIRHKIFKPKPFKPYDASKPFISPVKKSKENVQENIQGNTQESSLHSNSNPIESAPKVIIEN